MNFKDITNYECTLSLGYCTHISFENLVFVVRKSKSVLILKAYFRQVESGCLTKLSDTEDVDWGTFCEVAGHITKNLNFMKEETADYLL